MRNSEIPNFLLMQDYRIMLDNILSAGGNPVLILRKALLSKSFIVR